MSVKYGGVVLEGGVYIYNTLRSTKRDKKQTKRNKRQTKRDKRRTKRDKRRKK